MIMHPFERKSTEAPAGVLPHLDMRLKAGWRFDRRRRALVSEGGGVVSLRRLLPSGTRVVPMAPSLAEADPRDLSEDERLLARYLQVVLPSDADPGAVAPALRGLDEVELVSTPPRIGLP
jgi:hypothetical protein